jgi:hypothetical protein
MVTDAERRRILRKRARPSRTPRRLTSRQSQRACDPPEPDWTPWEKWLETRLAAERKTILRAVVKIVGQSLGETISESLAAERDAWESKLRALRL